MSVPVYINVRDRVTPLRKLVSWLEGTDSWARITLLDNASTYEPLLAYLEDTPHKVVRLGQNLGSRSIWLAGLAPDEPYVFTDPDIVPIDECPLDAVDRFGDLLDRFPVPKVGFGLYLADLPDTIDPGIVRWESGPQITGPFVAEGARQSLIDTTFALYRPGLTEFSYQGIRTDFPYQARHLSPSWYGGELTDEDRFYLDGAIVGPAGSSWAQAVAA